MTPPKHQNVSIPTKRSLSPLVDRRQSQRIKSAASTAISVVRGSGSLVSANSESESGIDMAHSGYEDDEQSGSSSFGGDAEEEDKYSSKESLRRKSHGSRKSDQIPALGGESRKGRELWREGMKSELQPGQEIYIKLPQARKAGQTPYSDETLHPNTLLFLGDLKSNNEREWLKVHDAEYRQAQKDFNGFVESLTEKIITHDETIPELPPKDLVFRIYRDVRFSNDPTPYKTHFSAAWSRTGRKGPFAAYYLQVAPGSSFVGGGLWHPEAAPLALLRKDVDRKSHRLKNLLGSPRLRKEFLSCTANDENKVVKAFMAQNSENALKRKPKGFEDNNPNIGLLRLKNYTIGRKLKDEEVLGLQGLNKIADLMGILTPFVVYLNSIVMPEPDGNSSGGDDGG